MHYLDKVYQVTMSAHQLAILLCFETKDSVTLSYIEKATGLSDELLSRNARALVDSGILIMAKKVFSIFLLRRFLINFCKNFQALFTLIWNERSSL